MLDPDRKTAERIGKIPEAEVRRLAEKNFNPFVLLLDKQLLTLAQNVEQSKLFSPARATKTTARSRRNSILVGALIGLVLGILAALLWEPAVRVARRTSV